MAIIYIEAGYSGLKKYYKLAVFNHLLCHAFVLKTGYDGPGISGCCFNCLILSDVKFKEKTFEIPISFQGTIWDREYWN